ncbi:MAG: T9SS type A sorting domain-containing protein [Lewinellaceae bacterium]|nr:T9SS type A sorting domain-containing protein [Lewinellaceae bacterium]
MTIIRYLLPLLMIAPGCTSAQAPAAPSDLIADGYDSHIELRWTASPTPGVTGYEVYRSENGGTDFLPLKSVSPSVTSLIDWTGDEGDNLNRQYKVRATAPGGMTSNFSPVVLAETHVMSDEELLEMVQRYTFLYFWDYAHPTSGLARERNNGNPQVVTMGGSGFGILSIIVGAERGWVTREEAVNRMIKIVTFLQIADRFHGVFPHWMYGSSGKVFPFSQYDNGGDLVETAFLMQGLLTARRYFDEDTPLESALRNAITGLWEDVEWDWYRKNGSNVLYWHWSPEYQWQINLAIRGFNEAQIIYLLAIASPTHGVPASLYSSGWTGGSYQNLNTYYGYKVYTGPYAGGPLFFAHYSYLGFDPRNKKDQYCNYFVRNRNHALIHQTYCAINPKGHQGYSENCWGLTASDDPGGYAVHDPFPLNDNGTISPTAALASMPYTPDESIKALKHFYRNLGENLWGPYGFYDAFNLNQNWYASSYLAIDQGPIVAMIENYRTGLLWETFMENPEIQPALDAIGFQEDLTDTDEHTLESTGFDVSVFPNPVKSGGVATIEWNVLTAKHLSATLVDMQGKVLHTYFRDRQVQTGVFQEQVPVPALPAGTYLLQVGDGQFQIQKKLSVVTGD